MSLAWGGYRNGQIPLDVLTSVGPGALSGAPQYLHPAAAVAWRNFQGSLRSLTGARVVITEGYRTLALQQHYWNTLPFPQAATPGTSTHGWARAVDMANYQSVPRATLRALAESLGWSFSTGDRFNEPWHIEYVGSLSLAGGGDTTPINPSQPGVPMTTPAEVWGHNLFHAGQNVTSTAAANHLVWTRLRAEEARDRATQARDNAANSARDAAAALDTASRIETKLDALIAALGTGGNGGTVNLQPVLDAIATIPTAQQNGEAARAAIVK